MENLEYSAGIVSKGYWFLPFKKYIELYNGGKSDQEIRALQEEENFLLAPSKDYGKKAIGEVSKRAKALPGQVISLFPSLDVDNQKHINSLGIMMTDRLFFEFMREVYRADMIVGKEVLEDSAIRSFFKSKQDQSEKVASYTDYTLKRLRGAFKTYLREAGLLEDREAGSYYIRPLVDYRLDQVLKDQGLEGYLKVLKGER